jgi:protein gp37
VDRPDSGLPRNLANEGHGIMGASSKIEWREATWNPIHARRSLAGNDRHVGWYCEHVSEGCRNCYAEAMNNRFGTGLEFKPGNRDRVKIAIDERMLLAPLSWRKSRMIFVCSMTDLFADFVPDKWIDRMFGVMAICPQHIFQLLTKRPERMKKWFAARARNAPIECLGELYIGGWPLPNVWLGTSCEDQETADARIPYFLATPAAVRFVSCEPMLAPIDLRRYLDGHEEHGVDLSREIGSKVGGCIGWIPPLDWIICGGESGPHARSMKPAWARALRDQCAIANVPFFFKQWGEFGPLQDPKGSAMLMMRLGKKRAGRLLDGAEHNGMPRRVQWS